MKLSRSAKLSVVVDADEQHEFHSCVGALSWVCNVRTDIMIKVSEFQRKLNKATGDDAIKSNQ